jgi:hypothetical protein
MKSIETIRRQLLAGQFDFSRHAFKRSIERNISEHEIKEVGANVKIIEEYPDDKYSAGCLVLGYTSNGRPLHLQVSLTDYESLRIITIYEPDETQWVNFTQRR